MTFKYWVSNLNTDQGTCVANGDDLDRLVQYLTSTGLKVQDIGIQVVDKDFQELQEDEECR